MNNISTSPTPVAPDLVEGLEGRIALRMVARLHEACETTPHDISERLRFAREQALARAKATQRVAVAATRVQRQGPVAVLGGPPSVWWRLVTALPLVVLMAGLVLIQQHHDQEQEADAAEIDAALLADELPPAAYGDPGFSEFLHNSPTP